MSVDIRYPRVKPVAFCQASLDALRVNSYTDLGRGDTSQEGLFLWPDEKTKEAEKKK